MENLIRQVKKDNDISFFEWDLKNNYGIPIASGIYIVHIDAGEIGEKVLKNGLVHLDQQI